MSSPNCSSVENVSWPFAPRTTSWHGGKKRRRRRRMFRACLSDSQRSFSAKFKGDNTATGKKKSLDTHNRCIACLLGGIGREGEE
jgi:hypothetical protein